MMLGYETAAEEILKSRGIPVTADTKRAFLTGGSWASGLSCHPESRGLVANAMGVAADAVSLKVATGSLGMQWIVDEKDIADMGPIEFVLFHGALIEEKKAELQAMFPDSPMQFTTAITPTTLVAGGLLFRVEAKLPK